MANSAMQSDPNDTLLGDNDELTAVYEQSAKERDAAGRNYSRYFYVRGRGHVDYIDHANKCDQFYRGEQWSAADKKALEDEGRPAMTVNMILAAINSVKGEYSNKRADFKFKPKREGATIDQAMVLNKVVMHECDDSGYDDCESDMFDDGIILDRGFIDLRVGTEDNVAGEVEVKTLDPRHVIPDPDASNYDPKTWRDVITTEYMSLEEIALKYGEDKAKQVRVNVDTLGRYAVDSVEYDESEVTYGDESGGEVGAQDGAYYGATDVNSEGPLIKGVRVIDRQYWQVGTFAHFFNPAAGDSSPVPPAWNEQRVAQHAETFELDVIQRKEKRVRWTVSADKTLLYDDWSPYKTFTIIPFFPNFRRGHPIGMVSNLLNSQEILNKTTSQMLHIVNTTANSGWMIRSGSLMNMSADDLATKGAKTGIVLEVAPGAEYPEKITPNTVPTGVDAIGAKALESIYEISGVNRSMMGQDSASVAGVAIEHRKQSGLLQLQPVFDNLARSRRFVARKLLELIQGFYTDQRVFMISDYTNPDAAPEPMVVNEMVQNDETQGFTVVNDLSLGKYGVSIGTMPAKDVYNESQFMEAISLREAGIAVPDYHIINYSNLDKKQEMAEESKQMQGLAPPTEEELEMQQMMEEIQMATVQIGLEDKMADVDLKQAQARLAEAKALEASDTPGLEREKLELEGTIVQIEQATRERVNRLKELSEQMKNMNNNRAKLEVEKRKIMGNIATQALSNKQEKPTKPEK